MSGYIWGIMVTLLGLLLILIAVVLYVVWRKDADYQEEKKLWVWGLAGIGVIILILGVLLLIWGASARETAKAGIRETNQQTSLAVAQHQQLQALQTQKQQLEQAKTQAATQLRLSAIERQREPLRSCFPSPERVPKARKKVRFALPGSSST